MNIKESRFWKAPAIFCTLICWVIACKPESAAVVDKPVAVGEQNDSSGNVYVLPKQFVDIELSDQNTQQWPYSDVAPSFCGVGCDLKVLESGDNGFCEAGGWNVMFDDNMAEELRSIPPSISILLHFSDMNYPFALNEKDSSEIRLYIKPVYVNNRMENGWVNPQPGKEQQVWRTACPTAYIFGHSFFLLRDLNLKKRFPEMYVYPELKDNGCSRILAYFIFRLGFYDVANREYQESIFEFRP